MPRRLRDVEFSRSETAFHSRGIPRSLRSDRAGRLRRTFSTCNTTGSRDIRWVGSYLNRLPPTAEFRKLAEWFGLLSLFGQRAPDAMAEFLAELRKQTKAADNYHPQVDEHLARLPEEITSGVDAEAIAKAMSESFRQQIAAIGLRESAALLNLSAKSFKALSGEIAATLSPVSQEYKGIASTISAELSQLAASARQVEAHNARLTAQQSASGRMGQSLLALVLFLAGGLCGILLEKRETANLFAGASAQAERIQVSPVQITRVTRSQSSGDSHYATYKTQRRRSIYTIDCICGHQINSETQQIERPFCWRKIALS